RRVGRRRCRCGRLRACRAEGRGARETDGLGGRDGGAGMTSSAQLTRMLSMVPYLLNNGDTSVEQLASMYGVSSAQVVKDLETISWTGLPTRYFGEYIDVDIDGEGMARVSNADYLSRPLRFTADEAVALLLALRSLRDVASSEQLPAIDRALDKLQTLAGDRADAVSRAELRIQAGDEIGRAHV